jgi:hypothetical protein
MAKRPVKELPWDWVPPHASEAAKAEWQKPWWVRVREILLPTDETFRNLMLAMIESFTVAELQDAIVNRLDLVEAFVVVGKLRHRFTKGPARVALRTNHEHAYRWLVGWPGYDGTGPAGIVAELASRDPLKGGMLRSQEGWSWFQGECYELARFLRDFGELYKPPWNWPDIQPPPGHKPRALPSLTEVPPVLGAT